ncbi:MAG: RHS repeat-associated core domain-containing protein [Steroidobacteraceae bacterium]
MNGRVYDPLLGRFISADPYVTLPYDGQGLNRYAYALNNPLSFTDPSGFDPPPCMEASSGKCAQITVIGLKWTDWIRYLGGGSAQVASAKERDPCGQDSDALTCAMQGIPFVSPASIVLTVGTQTDSTLSRSRSLDAVQGFAARIGNLAISSSPVALLFGADPDFQWFDEPDSAAGRSGAKFGNVGYFVGGFGGIIRKGGSELLSASPSQIARSLQGTGKYPGVDRFKDITLKKGTIIYAGFPGQGYFYTTASALRRSANSASALFDGLQIVRHQTKGHRSRVAAFEVLEDTQAAFGLALANIDYGAGWLPQVVVPSFQTTLRYLDDFPLGL